MCCNRGNELLVCTLSQAAIRGNGGIASLLIVVVLLLLVVTIACDRAKGASFVGVRAISRVRPVITDRAVLRYCGKFTLATLSMMTGLIRDIAGVSSEVGKGEGRVGDSVIVLEGESEI
jgi:ABC-type siderophore export system fused ATPase/permease subunit